MIGGDDQRRRAENLRGREGMNVVAAAVGFDQQGIFAEMSQKAQLDLGIIRGEQYVAWLNGECSANLAAKLGADGNVLQVGIGRREPSRSGPGLPEGGVQAAGGGLQQRGTSIAEG